MVHQRVGEYVRHVRHSSENRVVRCQWQLVYQPAGSLPHADHGSDQRGGATRAEAIGTRGQPEQQRRRARAGRDPKEICRTRLGTLVIGETMADAQRARR